jgi:hypothetical protein
MINQHFSLFHPLFTRCKYWSLGPSTQKLLSLYDQVQWYIILYESTDVHRNPCPRYNYRYIELYESIHIYWNPCSHRYRDKYIRHSWNSWSLRRFFIGYNSDYTPFPNGSFLVDPLTLYWWERAEYTTLFTGRDSPKQYDLTERTWGLQHGRWCWPMDQLRSSIPMSSKNILDGFESLRSKDSGLTSLLRRASTTQQEFSLKSRHAFYCLQSLTLIS